MSIFNEISEALVKGQLDKTLELVNKSIEDGLSVNEIIDTGLAVGIRRVGDLWEEGEFFLPELMRGAEIMKAAMDILNPHILKQKDDTTRSMGKLVIGTVAGDIHDIGKTVVGSMLTASGFDVVDLGPDVSIDKFLGVAEKVQAEMICLSALLTTTMIIQKDLITELKKRNLRHQYIVMIGGAPVTQRWADEIGADGFAENAVAAVKKATELIKNK